MTHGKWSRFVTEVLQPDPGQWHTACAGETVVQASHVQRRLTKLGAEARRSGGRVEARWVHGFAPGDLRDLGSRNGQ